jgi:hypothetical protein
MLSNPIRDRLSCYRRFVMFMCITSEMGLSTSFQLKRNILLRGCFLAAFAALLAVATTAAHAQTTVPAALPVAGRVAYLTVPGGSYSQITNPGKVARDAAGDIFILDVGKPQVIELPASGPLQIIIPSTDTVMTNNSSYHATRMTVDLAGNVYIASTYNGGITKISRNTNGTYNLGTAETAISYPGGCAATGGTVSGTQDIAIDSSGNFYVAVNGTAQKGIVAMGPTIGTCKYIFGNNTNTPAVTAPPLSLTVDASGNVFYVDGAAVQEITAAQIASATVATPAVPAPIGNGSCSGCTALATPQAISFDAVGNIMIGQTTTSDLVLLMPLNSGFSSATPIYNMPSNMSAHIGAADTVTTNNQGDYFAANGGSLEIYGQGSYFASITSSNNIPLPFNLPTGDSTTGNPAAQYLFTQATSLLSGTNAANTVVPNGAPYGGAGSAYPEFKYSSTGCGTMEAVGQYCNAVTVFSPKFPGLATGGIPLYGASGSAIGVATELSLINGSIATIDTGVTKSVGTGLTTPVGVALDTAGNMYVADQGAGAVYKFAPGATTAGTSVVTFPTSGVTPSTLSIPSGVALDAAGDVFVADTGNNRILYMTTNSTGGLSTAQVLTVTGFTLNAPRGVAFDGMGKLYIADTGNARILRMANPLTTNITVPSIVGTNYTTPFTAPYAMAFDQYQNMYVADYGANAIIIIPGGYGFSATSTVNYGSGNGTSMASSVPLSGVTPNNLSGPTGVAVDASGSVYVADSGNSRILKIPQTGAVFATTPNVGVYGTATALYTATANQISKPFGLAMDVTGDIYFTDADQPGLYFAQRSQPSGSTAITIPMPLPDASVGGTTTASAILSNAGYFAPMTETVASLATPYSLSTNGCANAALTAGSTCTDIVTFTGPSTIDTNNASNLTFTTNEQGLTNSPTVATVLSGESTGGVSTVNIAGDATLTYGETETYKVTAKDAGGNPAAVSGSYTVSITGVSSGPSVTINGGVGSFILPGLNVGNYTMTITVGGITNSPGFAITINKAPLTISAPSVSRVFDTPNPAFAPTYTGLVNSDTSSVVSGSPVITTTAVRTTPAGTYSIVLSGTLTATNYTITEANGTLTITGSAPQIILFTPLPPLTHGVSYTLTGFSTSGLPLTYTATNATVSGTTITPTAAGTVTVTASQAGNSSYAPATSVSRTFTAQ